RPRVPRGDPDAGQHPAPEHRAAAGLLHQRPGGERAGVRVHGRRQPRRGAPRQGRRVPGVGPAVPDRAGGGARALLPAPRLQPDDRAPRRQVQQHPPRRRPGGPRGGLRAGQVPPLRLRRRRGQRRRLRVHVRRRRVVRLHRASAEYAYTLRVDEKSDVYSFGVVLLELVTGRRPVGDFGEGVDIVQWAKRVTDGRRESVPKVVDRRLSTVPMDEVSHLFFVSMLCVQENSVERPTMREVVQMLSEFPRHASSQPSPSSAPEPEKEPNCYKLFPDLLN
uniref:Serine-threonine/tyrosine-protein kinase catalytic domain-containing protein n=1 Tax=Aegilops tauschii subsp. strangulata TaxID=200361 RepID=A0A453HGL9_AEGTS